MSIGDPVDSSSVQARDDYDVFISYSRKDGEFVHQLWEAFKQHNKKPWLDQDNIPLTAKWREEIREGIEKADNFVFIISPDSVTSNACREEIELAVQLHKRLIPILYRYTSSRTVHEALREIQFIPFADDFASAFNTLIAALDTDIAHVKAHTSLLVSALNWQRHECDRSFLLNGGQVLAEAEQWLAQNKDKNPQPTNLHQEYINTSRQAEEEQKAIELRLRRMTPQQYRNRQALLNKVHQYWVKGVLENSLQNRAPIALGLDERLDTVAQPWNMTLETTEQPEKPIPAGTRIISLFDQLGAGRTLLILGEPGGGKTTALLELVRDLVLRAEQGIDDRIPVVFNLCSWIDQKQKITDWLVEELNTKYQVPLQIGQIWVKEQQLLLLLDGLDEVRAEIRDACVAALNVFQQEESSEMVVTSRIKDYESLSNKLSFQSAICLRLLTLEQVHLYLDSTGFELTNLRTLIREDRALQELTRSPLMLNIMTVAYQGVKIATLPQADTTQLFNSYIDRMFQHRQPKLHYSKSVAIRWLVWLAQQMSQQSKTVFFIEQLQPSWLQTTVDKMTYRLGVILLGGVVCWLIGGVIGGLFQWRIEIVIGWLLLGLTVGLFISLGRNTIYTVETLKWSWQAAFKSFIKGLFYGLVYGIGFEFIAQVILLLTTSEMQWSLIVILTTTLVMGMIFGVAGGLRGWEIETKTIPNQGIWRSIANAGIVGLAGGLIGGILFEPAFWSLEARNAIVAGGAGVAFGLLFGLILGGGQACIRHFSLRFVLYRKNLIPWNYAQFLDYATDLIFLQKVGGGYIFIHRLLLEHFAQMK